LVKLWEIKVFENNLQLIENIWERLCLEQFINIGVIYECCFLP